MKKVKVLALLVLLILFFSSCDPWYPTYGLRLRYFAENNSGTPIIIEFYNLSGFAYTSDTAKWNECHPYLCPLENSDIKEERSVFLVQRCRAVVNSGFPCTEIFNRVICMVDQWGQNECDGNVTLYNLQDTTMFTFSSYREGMPFVEHTWMRDTVTIGEATLEADTCSDFHITITDSNLATMRKDYSMLEKFPQYYGEVK